MVPKPAAALADLYRADETAWLDAMVELLDLGAHEALDYEHLREFLDDMSTSNRNEVENRLRVLIRHMLKWDYQPGKRSPSWRSTLNEQREQLNQWCRQRVLRNYAEEVLADVYPKAADQAADDTELPLKTFPARCPYTLEYLLTFVPPRVGPDGQVLDETSVEPEGDDE